MSGHLINNDNVDYNSLSHTIEGSWALAHESPSAPSSSSSQQNMSAFQQSIPFTSQGQLMDGLPQTSPSSRQPMYDSPQENSRRTLTQEQFDAFPGNTMMNNGISADGSNGDGYTFSSDVLGQVYPQNDTFNYDNDDFAAFVHDSTEDFAQINDMAAMPATTIDPSQTLAYPVTSGPHDSSSLSPTATHWAHSRHPSVQTAASDGFLNQPADSEIQWQTDSGELNILDEEFQQPAGISHPQADAAPAITRATADRTSEMRRDSQTSILTQSMHSFGIHTPRRQRSSQQLTASTADSIAARRQRPRPASLSLRSQSISGPVQSGMRSPTKPPQQQQQQQSQHPQMKSQASSQSLRRMRSSQTLGPIAQGRVMKSGGASGARSPMPWTKSQENLRSPRLTRHMSHQTLSSKLAPPSMPMTPNESPHMGAGLQGFQGWMSNSAQVDHMESGLYDLDSPPDTPSRQHQRMQQQQAFAGAADDFAGPTLSAPPFQPFAVQQSQSGHQRLLRQQSMFQLSQSHPYQPQQYVDFIPQDQQQAMLHWQMQSQMQNNMGGAPPVPPIPAKFVQQVGVAMPASMPDEMNGHMQMTYPSQVHLVPAQPQMQQLHPQTPTPTQMQAYTFLPNGMTNMQQRTSPTRTGSMQTADFYVHEYSPAHEMKRGSNSNGTPRKPVGHGPKLYTFANQTCNDFNASGEKKTKTRNSVSPCSS